MPPIRIDKPVIATATREFAHVGFHGTTGEIIAKKAKVTEGSVFRVFGSKENIFARVVEHAAETLTKSLATIENEVAVSKNGDLGFVRNVAALLMTSFTPDVAHIIAYTILEQPKLAGKFEKVANAYERTVAKAIEDRIRKDASAKLAASQLLAYILHVQTFGPTATRKGREVRARRALVENFVEMWIKGVER